MNQRFFTEKHNYSLHRGHTLFNEHFENIQSLDIDRFALADF